MTQANYGNVFLLMIAGPVVGYLCGSLVAMAVDRDQALRAAAVAQSEPGWPGRSTTACCRCWRSSSAAEASSVATSPSWAGWPGAGDQPALTDPAAGQRGRARDPTARDLGVDPQRLATRRVGRHAGEPVPWWHSRGESLPSSRPAWTT